MTLNNEDKQLITGFLNKVPLFRNFSDENLSYVIEDFKIKRFQKGNDIVFQADEGTDLFIVIKGKVKVSLLGSSGNEFTLINFREGDFFGEMSLIDGKSRSASVIALEDTSLGILKRDNFVATMKQNAEIALDMLAAIVARLRNADEMIETLAFLDVNERLMKFIATAAMREGEKDSDGCYRMKKRTHLDLASNIGSSRESVSKAMKVLALKQLIVEKDGYLIVPPGMLN